jgi:hypothetical protein
MTMEHEAPEEALRRNVERIKTEGLDAATDAAFALLRDPKAPAQAKSATINAIYRAAGLFGREADNDRPPELHEMTAEQMAREVRKLTRDLERGIAPSARDDPADDAGGIFG